jgi:hypothetical protein
MIKTIAPPFRATLVYFPYIRVAPLYAFNELN